MYGYPALPIACGLSILLMMIPLSWHWRAKNSGTLLFIFWATIGNFLLMVNTIHWRNSLANDAPVWCDIATRLNVGAGVGISAATLCINRKLFLISRVNQVSATDSQKRKNMIIELLIGIGIPILVMGLYTISQGHRYDIIEDIGCWQTVYNTPVAYPTVYLWPVFLGLISVIYAGLSVRAFLQRRATFRQLLKSSGSGMNVKSYFRLMALSATEIAFVFPFAVYNVVINVVDSKMYPWKSWADTHYNFQRVGFFSSFWFHRDKTTYITFGITFWTFPATGFIFFLYFGFAEEARRHYADWYWKILALFGKKRPVPVVTSEQWSGKDRSLSSVESDRTPISRNRQPAKRSRSSFASTIDLESNSFEVDREDAEKDFGLQRRPAVPSLPVPAPGSASGRYPDLETGLSMPMPPPPTHQTYHRRLQSFGDSTTVMASPTSEDASTTVKLASSPNSPISPTESESENAKTDDSKRVRRVLTRNRSSRNPSQGR